MTDVVHVGAKFGRWTVVSTASERGSAYVVVACECGKSANVFVYNLTRGTSSKCRPCANKRGNPKHGHLAGGNTTPEYMAWVNIRQRCANSKRADFARYGGRGISVSDEWMDSFDTFLKDMGPRPSPNHSIDRIDVNKGYCASNCRWATASEQANNKRNNRRFEAFGESLTSAEWGKRFGLKPWTVNNRVSAGMSVEQALSKPIRKCVRNGGNNGR